MHRVFAQTPVAHPLRVPTAAPPAVTAPPCRYALNCEWLTLGRWPSLTLLTLLLVALSLTVGLTAVPVKNGVTLGVEFGGGYSML